MTLVDLSVPLALGFVSSLHCAGMCGPIVLAYSVPLGSNRQIAHLAYNAGRIMTYSFMGALAGAVGGGVSTVGHIAGFERYTAVVIGCVMIFVGLAIAPRSRLVNIGVPSVFSRAVGKLLRDGNRFSLGAMMGFLPCGLVYAALLQAMSTAEALTGALSMAAFGIGTAFMLIGIGMLSGKITARLGRYSATLMSASVIALGLLAIWRGLSAPVVPGRCH